MEFRIADTFTDSLARLMGDEQKAVKTTAFDLQLNPTSPGMSFHKLDKAKDKNFWSVRVDSDIRLIVHKTDTSFLLCYVGHHDNAYDWAERRKLETHPNGPKKVRHGLMRVLPETNEKAATSAQAPKFSASLGLAREARALLNASCTSSSANGTGECSNFSKTASIADGTTSSASIEPPLRMYSSRYSAFVTLGYPHDD
jgi:mRNA-degrading endonuclease RelE of RelBE toxin-antitoxin system